jgi:hypothetical protein
LEATSERLIDIVHTMFDRACDWAEDNGWTVGCAGFISDLEVKGKRIQVCCPVGATLLMLGRPPYVEGQPHTYTDDFQTFFPDLPRNQLWSFIWGYDAISLSYAKMDSQYEVDYEWFNLGQAFHRKYISHKDN